MLELINFLLLSVCSTHYKQGLWTQLKTMKVPHVHDLSHHRHTPFKAYSLEATVRAAAVSPAEDFSFLASSSLCGHFPCIVLLKGSENQPRVQ